MHMGRKLGAIFAVALLSGCGLLEGALSDLAAQDFEADMFPPLNIGEAPLVDDVEMTASVDAENPVFEPSNDMGPWGYVIAAHNDAVANGEMGVFQFDVTDFVFTSSEPVHFDVEVFSRNGNIVFAEGAAPTDVAACSFELDPATHLAADLSSNMSDCFTTWVATNGIPADFAYRVTTTTQSEVKTSHNGDYTATHKEIMLALNNLESEDYERNLKVSADLADNWQKIVLENLEIESTASWNELSGGDIDCIPLPGTDLSVRGKAEIKGPGDDTPILNVSLKATMQVDRTHLFNHPEKSSPKNDFKPVFKYEGIEVGTGGITMDDWITGLMNVAVATRLHNEEQDRLEEEGEPFTAKHKAVIGNYTVVGHCPRIGFLDFKARGTAGFDL
jgi:hypothetical protein